MSTPPPVALVLDTSVFTNPDATRQWGGGAAAAFELAVHLQSPERYHQTVPGTVLYHLIDDIRSRIDKGLRVAEKAVRTAGAADPSSDVGDTIAQLRDQYRAALRSGLLDSKEDVDLILLAREVDGALVSSDQGVVSWVERLGVRLVQQPELAQAQSEPHDASDEELGRKPSEAPGGHLDVVHGARWGHVLEPHVPLGRLEHHPLGPLAVQREQHLT